MVITTKKEDGARTCTVTIEGGLAGGVVTPDVGTDAAVTWQTSYASDRNAVLSVIDHLQGSLDYPKHDSTPPRKIRDARLDARIAELEAEVARLQIERAKG